MTPNAMLSGATLEHLTALGVQDFMVCAGARNAPLIVSLLGSPQKQDLRIYHHFDERSAAFFALGLSKRLGRPSAVLTTSGTAAAELLPAAIEGFYSGIPLILVTADRPAIFRGSGAPQAILQEKIFGPYTSTCLDVEKLADFDKLDEWTGDTPLHINLCMEEPVAGDYCTSWRNLATPSPSPQAGKIDAPELLEFCFHTPRIAVLAGELPTTWQKPAADFIERLGAPVWAEATSGLRECSALSKQLLQDESLVGRWNPGGILRLGGVPSLRFWRDLETCPSLPVFSVSNKPFSGLARKSSLLVCEKFPSFAQDSNFKSHETISEVPSSSLEDKLVKWPMAEPSALREISLRIPSEALVFLGNSLPIREWNLAAALTPPHSQCFASRGANGIDGQVSTFLGLSVESGESWGIFGDLTALCDLNAPALLEQLPPGNRRIVVLNNRGGKIFSRLPSMAGLKPFEKAITENSHTHQFSHWAGLWGLDYVLWIPGTPFPQLPPGSCLLEVVPDESQTNAFWEALA